MVVSCDHVLGAQIEKRPYLRAGRFFDIAFVAFRDAVGQRHSLPMINIMTIDAAIRDTTEVFNSDGSENTELDASLPVDGPQLSRVQALMEAGMAEGWLCPRENEGVRFGRLAKASPETHGFSIDAVIMDGPGPGHTHPNGEIDLCFATAGQPRFDGHPPGWTAYGPGSWHVPTVSGGQMAILYFLPEGAIRFEGRPSA